MPNFFKKLTGSLQMPEEEDLFSEDELKETEAPSSDPKDFMSEEEDFSPEPEEEKPEEESAEATDEEKLNEPEESVEPEPTQEEELKVDSTEEESSDTYTIAQLAQATTKKQSPKKSHSSNAFSKLQSLKKGRENEDKLEPEGQLAIDVYETPTHIIINSTIAGVKAEDLDVGIEDNVVNIRGSRHREERVEDVDYFYQECYWGTFSRSVILPVEVDTDKAEALLSNGVLTLKIPKIIKEKEKKIKVIG